MGKAMYVALPFVLCHLCQGSLLRVDSAKSARRSETGVSLRAKVGYMVQDMLRNKLSSRHIAQRLHKHMRMSDALPALAGRLPQDVMALVRMSNEEHASSSRAFSEVSLAKARVYLNNMMYDAWLQLDQIEVECKEFYMNHKEVFDSVESNLAQIGSESAAQLALKVKAEDGIADADTRILKLEGNLHDLKRAFMLAREKNAYELSLRQDDQDVFTAILQLSKCPNEYGDDSYSLAQFKICQTGCGNGTQQLDISDQDLAAKVKKSPRVAKALMDVIGQANNQDSIPGMDVFGQASNLDSSPGMDVLGQANNQTSSPGMDVLGQAGNQTSSPGMDVLGQANNQTSSPGPQAAPSLLQVAQAPPATEVETPACSWKKCINGKVNCGYLHDLMALEWGKFKDLVDELTYIMMQNRDTYEGEKENLNEQIATLKANKMASQEMLGEAVSQINILQSEEREKSEQKKTLNHAFEVKDADCKRRIEEILFTNICGTRTVRNNLMQYSEVSPTRKIADCDVTDWSDGPCTTDGRGTSPSVDCDDSCPADVGGQEVDACGGIMYLTREVVVSPNGFGMACPPLFFERKNGTKGIKCNQFHCPIHCQMSEWTGWSACSKECGGGAQEKTRSILVKPRNRGTECDTTLDSQSCNTGNCDRDCTLMPWTEWSPCSMACGGGIQERVRKVDIPIRANGKCPDPKNADRFQMQDCNVHECVGDEICIARQDLVIAIDGSGSVKQEGFDVIKKFALNLTSKYQSVYYGTEDMKVGLVLFGNGEYFENNTVSAALEVVPITSDLESVSTAIEGLQWQRGFTNMMQALTAADNMFAEGRDDAQSAVIMISDGKWTNAYRTGMKAQTMKDKGVQIFMAPIAEFDSSNLKQIREWASQPWETNYERIPGLDVLVNNEKEFAQRLLVKFCPLAFSPSQKLAEEQQAGFLKIHEEGYPSNNCGAWSYAGQRDSPDACMSAVREKGILSFSFEDGGRWAGTCYAEAVEVTAELWASAIEDRVNMSCPGGTWITNKYASTYIMNPSMFGDLFGED